MRMLEFLQYTSNPEDRALIGEQGRASMLRTISGTFMGGDDIVPGKDEIEARMRAAQAQQVAMQAQQAVQAQQGQQPAPQEQKGASQQMAAETDNMHRTTTVQ
jgi:hypothetical protein